MLFGMITSRQVELFFNQSDASRFWSYVPEARMRCAERRLMDLPEDDRTALDEVWIFFNQDERPNANYDRCLAVGDVVTLDERDSYAVSAAGFRRVPLLTGGERLTADQWTEQPHRVTRPGRFGF